MAKLLCKRGPTLRSGSFHSFKITRKHCLLLLAGCAMMLLGPVFVAPRPATASVCGVSASGAEDQTGGGSTAPASDFSVACGRSNSVGIGGGWAFGYNNKAGTTNAGSGVAFGASNTASGPQGTAFGAGNTASGSASTALGYSNTASAFISTAVGRLNTANGGYSTAVGYANTTSGYVSTALGYGNNTSGGDYSTALGYANVTSDFYSMALGYTNVSRGYNSIALGSENEVTGANSLAIGHNTAAGGTVSNGFTNAGATAIGANAQAGTTAASQINATAVGRNATANAINASAFGIGATASGNHSAAFGRASAASGTSALALGNGAQATENSAVAIGSNSVADVASVVSVGAPGNERRIVNVRKAVDPTDAVNLQQVQALIAAGAAPRVVSAQAGKRSAQGGGAGSMRGQRLASLGESDAVSGVGERSARTAAPVASLSCQFDGGKVTTAVGEQSSAVSTFGLIQQSGISFQQGGAAPGCVTVSFSAEVRAPGASIMEVRAVLNGSIEASPGPVLFAQDIEAFNARGFNFLFADVAPGAHRVEIHFRNAGEAGWVRIGQRTTMVQFAR